MATVRFRLPIGAKRQVTIPRDCMDLLSLEEGGELMLEVVGDHAVLLPVVSIPRRDLPEELRRKFMARRGSKPSDVPLGRFLDKIGYTPDDMAPARKASSTARKRSARPAGAVASPAVKPA